MTNRNEFLHQRYNAVRAEIKEIDERINELSERRVVLRRARESLRRKLYTAQDDALMRDTLLVRASDVMPYFEMLLAERPIYLIAQELKIGDRTLRRIKNGEQQWVAFNTADKILTYAGFPHEVSELRLFDRGWREIESLSPAEE